MGGEGGGGGTEGIDWGLGVGRAQNGKKGRFARGVVVRKMGAGERGRDSDGLRCKGEWEREEREEGGGYTCSG